MKEAVCHLQLGTASVCSGTVCGLSCDSPSLGAPLPPQDEAPHCSSPVTRFAGSCFTFPLCRWHLKHALLDS